jgi:hypothetical protein
MFRRTILRWMLSGVLPLVKPRWIRAASSGISAENVQTLDAVGAVVLPNPRGGLQKGGNSSRREGDFLRETEPKRSKRDSCRGYEAIRRYHHSSASEWEACCR